MSKSQGMLPSVKIKDKQVQAHSYAQTWAPCVSCVSWARVSLTWPCCGRVLLGVCGVWGCPGVEGRAGEPTTCVGAPLLTAFDTGVPRMIWVTTCWPWPKAQKLEKTSKTGTTATNRAQNDNRIKEGSEHQQLGVLCNWQRRIPCWTIRGVRMMVFPKVVVCWRGERTTVIPGRTGVPGAVACRKGKKINSNKFLVWPEVAQNNIIFRRWSPFTNYNSDYFVNYLVNIFIVIVQIAMRF